MNKLYTKSVFLVYGISPTLSHTYLGLRVYVHIQPLNALEGVICEAEGELVAITDIQPLAIVWGTGSSTAPLVSISTIGVK
jgi:hypothetical protein